jgi:hypothetical protein
MKSSFITTESILEAGEKLVEQSTSPEVTVPVNKVRRCS